MLSTLRKAASDSISIPSTLLICKVSILGLFAGYTVYKLNEYRKKRLCEEEVRTFLKRHAENMKLVREDSIETARVIASTVKPEDAERIERMNFEQLREALQSEEISCETVIRVYFGLALKAHEKTNCITFFIKDALKTAIEMDEKYHRMRKPRLYGIPISIKESIWVSGTRSTGGISSQADNFVAEDNNAVAKLKKAGMIPFCKTNVPPCGICYSTSNSLFGTTTHPLDPTRTSGGSTGGEGALIAAGGSLIGLGGDGAGSIRIPAAYSGCYGFKPTSARFPPPEYGGPLGLEPFCILAHGPLAREPTAIISILGQLWGEFEDDDQSPFCAPVTRRTKLFASTKKLKIGYYTTDGYVDPLPGIQRAVREAANWFRAKGHEVVEFSPDPIPSLMAEGIMAGIMVDGGAAIAEILKYEPLCDLNLSLREFGEMPAWKKWLKGCYYKLKGDKRVADFYLNMPRTALDMKCALDTIQNGRKEMVDRMKEDDIDLILCPATLSPALPHDLPNKLGYVSVLSTMLWNAMDFPAGVIPFSKWSEADEKSLESYEEIGSVEKGIKNGSRGSVGLPIGVQLVALPYRDEIVLRAMVEFYNAQTSVQEN